MADIAKGVGERLHALGVLGDRRIIVHQRVELVEVGDVSLADVVEFAFDGRPEIMSRLIWLDGDG